MTTCTINKIGTIILSSSGFNGHPLIEGVDSGKLKAKDAETLEDIMQQVRAQNVPLPLVISGHGLGKGTLTINDPAAPAAAAPAAAPGFFILNGICPQTKKAWRLKSGEVKGDAAGIGDHGGVVNRDASEWNRGTIGKSPLVTTCGRLSATLILALEIMQTEIRFASGASRTRLTPEVIKANAKQAARDAGHTDPDTIVDFCMDYQSKSENHFSASGSGNFYLCQSPDTTVQVGLPNIDTAFKAAFRGALRELGLTGSTED